MVMFFMAKASSYCCRETSCHRFNGKLFLGFLFNWYFYLAKCVKLHTN